MYESKEAKVDLHQQLIKWLGDSENSTSSTIWNEEASEDYKFYAGDQDTTEVKLLLKAQHRPCTVYNEIKPKIDMLAGMAAELEGASTLMPRSNEDAPLTELMTGVVDFFREKMRLNNKEGSCFEHGIKSGQSWLHFYIDELSPDNTLKSQRVPGRDMHKDPDSVELDLEDCRYLFRDKWFTAENIEEAWLQFTFARDHAGNVVGDNVDAVHEVSRYTPTFFNEASEKHRIVECWWRKYEIKYLVKNPLTGKPETLFEEVYKNLKKSLKAGIELPNGEVLQQNDLPAAEIKVRSIYYAMINGTEVIEVARSNYKHGMFPYVYLEAYHDEENNAAMSVIKSMKDPQRGLNTTRRQLVHLLQTAPKGILMHEVGAVLNIEDYEENSSKPGFHMEIAQNKLDKVKFSQQPQISNIYAQLDGLFQQSMKDSSGIQDSLLGIQTSTREPGVTARMRNNSAVAVLRILFDKYTEFKYNCTKILIANIQQFVTTPQLIRIKGQAGMELVQINSQLNPQSEGWNDIGAAKFDLIIDEDIVTKSTRLATAQILADFNQNNPGAIPPDLFLEYANLPYTAVTRIRENSAQQQQIQAQSSAHEQGKELKELELKEREVEVKEEELLHEIDMDNKELQRDSKDKPKQEDK